MLIRFLVSCVPIVLDRIWRKHSVFPHVRSRSCLLQLMNLSRAMEVISCLLIPSILSETNSSSLCEFTREGSTLFLAGRWRLDRRENGGWRDAVDLASELKHWFFCMKGLTRLRWREDKVGEAISGKESPMMEVSRFGDD